MILITIKVDKVYFGLYMYCSIVDCVVGGSEVKGSKNIFESGRLVKIFGGPKFQKSFGVQTWSKNFGLATF
jgi:hypothetical protein